MCTYLKPFAPLLWEQLLLLVNAISLSALSINTPAKRSTHVDHTVSVGLDTNTLKQLDNLRRAHPTIPSRTEVIKRLIWDAHAKIPQ